MFPSVEKETTEWVLQQAGSVLLITSFHMAEKALEIAEREIILNVKASDGWIKRPKNKISHLISLRFDKRKSSFLIG